MSERFINRENFGDVNREVRGRPPVSAQLIRALGNGVGPDPHLLSFAEAQIAGEAIFDTWKARTGKEPMFARDDCAWADLARQAWEAVWSSRRR